MNVSEAILTKRAVRQFKEQSLPEDIVHTILNAGRRAQSSKNSQPWHFVAIQDKAVLKALSECGNWAGHLAGAALGVAMVSPDYTERFQILFDLGQASSYMQLAAWELGVGSCPATIYQVDQAREVLGFPQDMVLRFALSFGYPLDASQLTTPSKKGGRKPFDESVHWDHW